MPTSSSEYQNKIIKISKHEKKIKLTKHMEQRF